MVMRPHKALVATHMHTVAFASLRDRDRDKNKTYRDRVMPLVKLPPGSLPYCTG
jgi:hypothetical protein